MPEIIFWTPQEDQKLLNLRASGLTFPQIAERIGRPINGCKFRYYNSLADKHPTGFKESPFPQYTDYLKMEGDALILPDIELPFHNADFVNRCLELAQAWGIKQCIVAGDVLHFDSISSWEANWMEKEKQGIPEPVELKLIDFFKTLPSKHQEHGFDLLDKLGHPTDGGDPNISQELAVARRELKVLSELFDQIDFVLGNHEGRLLSALSSPMFPSELLVQLKIDNPKWRIAPFYFSLLTSGGREFQIEHPKSAARITAKKLAGIHHRNILMAHSHDLDAGWDVSKKYYAWHIGHCVDPSRLPYKAQRHTSNDAWALGACIVRDGFPWLLHVDIPWERYARA